MSLAVGRISPHRVLHQSVAMAGRLIILWICIAVVSALGSWLWGGRAPRETLWIKAAVAVAVLIGCVVSFLLFGDTVEKTFAAVALYFSVWSAVYIIAALSAGMAAGSLIALQFRSRQD